MNDTRHFVWNKNQKISDKVKVLQPVRSNQIIVKAHCRDTPVNLLIDTGASLSLVNTRFINQMSLQNHVVPTSTLITGLGKKLIPLQGEIRLPIVLGNCQTVHVFAVCNNLENEFLIGMDVLQKLEAKIDLPNKKILTPRGEAEFLSKPISIKNRLKIRCNKNITIPANSAGYLWGKVPIRNARENYEGVIEGYRKLALDNGVFITGSLSYSDKSLIPIHYVNATSEIVTIYRNQLVAFLEPMEKSDGVKSVHRVTQTEGHYDASINIPRLPDAEPVEETIRAGKWSNPSELHKQLGIDQMKMSDAYKCKLKDLITEYSHCFSRNRFDLGKASFAKAKISLKRDYVAKWVPSRPVSYKHEPHMDEEIENMIKADHITRCPYSLWNSATFLVSKPNAQGGSKFRFVQDARALNSQCIQDSYELPRISNILDRMSDCKWLSNLDFQSSFTQIGLEKTSQPLTAFTYKGDRYMWLRLVMGQTSSSAQFSRCINQLFSRVPFESLVLYVDDVLLWSSDLDSHLTKLRFVFERLTWGNLKLNGRKTKLCASEVKFLGHRVSRDGVKLDDDRVKAVQALPAPTSVKQIQQVLGVFNYMRAFIKGFATIASPLYNLLKKGTKFEWTQACQASFQTLKDAVTGSPVLSIPDTSDKNQSYHVIIDSSKRGQGATLSQEIGGKRRLIAYWSRAVPKHQQRFGATRLELIALHGALKNWRMYLQGTKFLVKTDCRALLSLSTIFKNENSYFQRRLADLSCFNFEVEHVSGKSSDIRWADFLSRYAYETTTRESSTQTATSNVNNGRSSCTESKINQIMSIGEADKSKTVTLEEIKAEYSNDRILSTVIKWIRQNRKPDDFNHRSEPDELCQYWKDFNLLKLKDGVLYREWIDANASTRRQLIVVPCTLIERTLYSCHDTIATCHAGVDACVYRCRQKFYFYKLKHEFELYIGSCLQCARSKQPKAFLRAPMKPIVYSEFNQAISIDHLEPSKTPTPRGVVALLTICDMYSNYLVCVPVRSVSTEASIKAIVDHWILKHGVPEVITHDLGAGFTSGLWKAVMKAFDIKDVKTTPKYSQSNGKAEACNRKLNQCFRVTLNEREWKNYDLYVKYIVFCLNSLACSRTKLSPNFLVYGRELRMPRDLFVKDDSRLEDTLMKDTDINYNTRKQARDLYKGIAQITRKVRDNSEKRVKYMKKQYDKRTRGPFFEVGDMCLLLELWPKHKYALKFRGPYKIVEKISDHNYVVDVDGDKKVVSISKMKHYVPNKYSAVESASNRAGDVNEHVPSKSKHKKSKVITKSDSSDDDNDVIVTMYRPKTKRRSPRLADKSRKALPSQAHSPVTVTETEQSSASHQSETDTWVTTGQETTEPEFSGGETGAATSQPTDADTSGEQEFLDATEALDEANQQAGETDNSVVTTTPDINNSSSLPTSSASSTRASTRVSTSPARGSNIATSTPRPHFPATNTRVNLSDIERYEILTRHGLASTSSRARPTATESPEPSSLSRYNSRYALRDKPAKTKRFGLMKTGSSSKTKKPAKK